MVSLVRIMTDDVSALVVNVSNGNMCQGDVWTSQHTCEPLLRDEYSTVNLSLLYTKRYAHQLVPGVLGMCVCE